MTAKYVVSELCARNFYHEMRCTDTAAAEIPKKTPNDWADTNLLGHDSLRGMGGRRVGQSVSSQIANASGRSRAFSVKESKSGKLRAFFLFPFLLSSCSPCAPFRVFRVSAPHAGSSVRRPYVSKFHVAVEAAKEAENERRDRRRSRDRWSQDVLNFIILRIHPSS